MLLLEGAAVGANATFPLVVAALIGSESRTPPRLVYIVLAVISIAEVFLLFWRRHVEFLFVRDFEYSVRASIHDRLLTLQRVPDAVGLMTSDIVEFRRFLTLGLIYTVINSILIVTLISVLIAVAGAIGVIAALFLVGLATTSFVLQRREGLYAALKLRMRGALALWLRATITDAEATQEAAADNRAIAGAVSRAEQIRLTLKKQTLLRVRYLVVTDGSVPIAILCAAIVSWFLSVNDSLTASAFTAFILVAAQLVWPLQSLGAAVPLVRSGRAAGTRIKTILQLEDDLPRPPHSNMAADEVVVRDYEAGIAEIAARSGAVTVGIAGRSSTERHEALLRLLPTIQTLVQSSGSDIGWARDRPALYRASLSENLYLNSMGDAQRAVWALRAACADFAVSLDGTIDEAITSRGRHGISTGQAARLGIARALYQSCTMCVLEETLQSVDALVAGRILRQFQSNPGGLQILIVTADSPPVLSACDVVIGKKTHRNDTEAPR